MRGIYILSLLISFCSAAPANNLLQCHDCAPIPTTFCDTWSCRTPDIEIIPGPVGNCVSARVTCPTDEPSLIITEDGLVLARGFNPAVTFDCTNDGWFTEDIQGVGVILTTPVGCQAM